MSREIEQLVDSLLVDWKLFVRGALDSDPEHGRGDSQFAWTEVPVKAARHKSGWVDPDEDVVYDLEAHANITGHEELFGRYDDELPVYDPMGKHSDFQDWAYETGSFLLDRGWIRWYLDERTNRTLFLEYSSEQKERARRWATELSRNFPSIEKVLVDHHGSSYGDADRYWRGTIDRFVRYGTNPRSLSYEEFRDL